MTAAGGRAGGKLNLVLCVWRRRERYSAETGDVLWNTGLIDSTTH